MRQSLRQWTIGAAVVAALGGGVGMAGAATVQRVIGASVRVVRQTADSAVVVVRCVTSNADTVRAAWSYPTRTRTVALRPSSCNDTLRVARGTVAQTASVTLTPKRGATVGAARSASVSIAARVVVTPPPTVDSIRVDTAGTVVTPPVVTPPTTPSAFTPNLPAGLTKYGETTFGETEVSRTGYGTAGLLYAMDDAAVSGGRNVAVSDSPYGPNVFETYYPGNSRGDGWGGARIIGETGQRWKSFYFAMAVWVPTNYSIHSNGEKWLYLHTSGGSATVINWEPDAPETPNGTTFGLWLLPDLSNASYDAWVRHPVAGPRLRKGVWQHLEVYLQMNTPGASNGIYRAWINGAAAVNNTSMKFYTDATQATIEGIKFDGTRGGGASDTPTPAGGQVRRYGKLAWYAAR